MRRTRVIAGGCVLLVLTCSGLLFSAVQRVREAAAVSMCTCVKQLAFGVQIYAENHEGRLPCGPPPPVGLPPERRLSWVVETLPFVEGHDTYKRFDLKGPADSEQNRAASATYRYYGHLVCPKSPVYARRGPDEPELPPVPITNRVGVAGVGADAPELPEKHTRTGAFGHDRRAILPLHFTDGTSNTLLILETGYEPGHWAFNGPATVRPCVPGTAPYIGPGRPFGGFHRGPAIWAPPPGGVMVAAMADTSIRTIRGDIDPAVFEALAAASGGEALPETW